MRYLTTLLLSLFLLQSLPSNAETVPAENRGTCRYGTGGGISGTVPNASLSACQSIAESLRPASQPYWHTGWIILSGSIYYRIFKSKEYYTSGEGYVNAEVINSVPSCPSDGGWTLQGTNCVRDDCPYGRNESTGTCQDKCASKAGQSSYGWVTRTIGGASPFGSFCADGCSQYVTGPVTGPGNPNGEFYTDGKTRTDYAKYQFDGSSCSSGSAPPVSTDPAKAPADPPKRPPCAASEGVMTSSSGKITCVPEGSPGSNTPIVTKQAETKTNPDGTKTITETTTTRDPSTGVEQKDSTTTTKDANGNTTGSSSSSGTSGTTNGGNPEKPGDSDFCQKNPTLDICTGKLNKEETQKKVADALSAESFDAATHLPTSLDVSSEARQKADQGKDLVVADIQKFGTAADPSSGKYSEFQDQMKGWLGEIPTSGCTPFSAKIGPYNWNFDHCEKALKIAEIFGYCLWVMLAFGVFSLATRNRG